MAMIALTTPGPEGRGQHDRGEQRRKGEDEVAELHDPVFDDALGEGRDEAEDDAEHEPDADRDDADQNRDARAGQDLRGDVASEIVGPEPVRRATAARACGECRSRPADRASRRATAPRRRSARRRAPRRATGSKPRAGEAGRTRSRGGAPSACGSIAAQAMSTTKFSPITITASSITPFSTTSVSRLEIDCSMRRPRPGRTNTFSTTIAPAIRLANCSPMMVRMGSARSAAHGARARRGARRPWRARCA